MRKSNSMEVETTSKRENFKFSVEFHNFSFVRRPLRQASSYDFPINNVTSQFRGMSVDHTGEVKHLLPDESQTINTWSPPQLCSSSSEHDNQETNAWSSDYSNSEDEYTILEDGAVPVSLIF